jgi:FkbM family methyltransferase
MAPAPRLQHRPAVKARFLYRALKARYRGERQEIAAVLRGLAPGDVAVDAGAHKGAYAYWMRRAVSERGRVFAFEPQPRLAAYLAAVGASLGWENVSVRECALSDTTGLGALRVPRGGSSQGAALFDGVAGENEETVPVRLATLDAEVAGAGRVAFLKVDVEGHELAVFRGAARILAEDAPIVLFECERRHLTGHAMEDVFAHLRGFGYEGSFFGPRTLQPLSEFDPAIHQRHAPGRFWEAPGYCNNFLFTPGRPRP